MGCSRFFTSAREPNWRLEGHGEQVRRLDRNGILGSKLQLYCHITEMGTKSPRELFLAEVASMVWVPTRTYAGVSPPCEIASKSLLKVGVVQDLLLMAMRITKAAKGKTRSA